ncbi:hypothetical protein BC830DRAFT_904527 [Chytriomyces sp. MP71]|nr:hypothetical protein BC830DRAFT_904527 [Chytriomyces sp. MP71]
MANQPTLATLSTSGLNTGVVSLGLTLQAATVDRSTSVSSSSSTTSTTTTVSTTTTKISQLMQLMRPTVLFTAPATVRSSSSPLSQPVTSSPRQISGSDATKFSPFADSASAVHTTRSGASSTAASDHQPQILGTSQPIFIAAVGGGAGACILLIALGFCCWRRYLARSKARPTRSQSQNAALSTLPDQNSRIGRKPRPLSVSNLVRPHGYEYARLNSSTSTSATHTATFTTSRSSASTAHRRDKLIPNLSKVASVNLSEPGFLMSKGLTKGPQKEMSESLKPGNTPRTSFGHHTRMTNASVSVRSAVPPPAATERTVPGSARATSLLLQQSITHGPVKPSKASSPDQAKSKQTEENLASPANLSISLSHHHSFQPSSIGVGENQADSTHDPGVEQHRQHRESQMSQVSSVSDKFPVSEFASALSASNLQSNPSSRPASINLDLASQIAQSVTPIADRPAVSHLKKQELTWDEFFAVFAFDNDDALDADEEFELVLNPAYVKPRKEHRTRQRPVHVLDALGEHDSGDEEGFEQILEEQRIVALEAWQRRLLMRREILRRQLAELDERSRGPNLLRGASSPAGGNAFPGMMKTRSFGAWPFSLFARGSGAIPAASYSEVSSRKSMEHTNEAPPISVTSKPTSVPLARSATAPVVKATLSSTAATVTSDSVILESLSTHAAASVVITKPVPAPSAILQPVPTPPVMTKSAPVPALAFSAKPATPAGNFRPSTLPTTTTRGRETVFKPTDDLSYSKYREAALSRVTAVSIYPSRTTIPAPAPPTRKIVVRATSPPAHPFRSKSPIRSLRNASPVRRARGAQSREMERSMAVAAEDFTNARYREQALARMAEAGVTTERIVQAAVGRKAATVAATSVSVGGSGDSSRAAQVKNNLLVAPSASSQLVLRPAVSRLAETLARGSEPARDVPIVEPTDPDCKLHDSLQDTLEHPRMQHRIMDPAESEKVKATHKSPAVDLAAATRNALKVALQKTEEQGRFVVAEREKALHELESRKRADGIARDVRRGTTVFDAEGRKASAMVGEERNVLSRTPERVKGFAPARTSVAHPAPSSFSGTVHKAIQPVQLKADASRPLQSNAKSNLQLQPRLGSRVESATVVKLKVDLARRATPDNQKGAIDRNKGNMVAGTKPDAQLARVRTVERKHDIMKRAERSRENQQETKSTSKQVTVSVPDPVGSETDSIHLPNGVTKPLMNKDLKLREDRPRQALASRYTAYQNQTIEDSTTILFHPAQDQQLLQSQYDQQYQGMYQPSVASWYPPSGGQWLPSMAMQYSAYGYYGHQPYPVYGPSSGSVATHRSIPPAPATESLGGDGVSSSQESVDAWWKSFFEKDPAGALAAYNSLMRSNGEMGGDSQPSG